MGYYPTLSHMLGLYIDLRRRNTSVDNSRRILSLVANTHLVRVTAVKIRLHRGRFIHNISISIILLGNKIC